ncbi:DUF3006 domain-containing protein [Clostridium sp. CTA-5]
MVDKYIVDRIEENYAVVENHEGDMLEVLISQIENIPKEGDVLVKKENMFIIDYEETKNRRDKINNMMKNMWK